MNKLTTECLEKFVNDIKTDGMCDITDHQVESALIQLLAYEQAADRPVGEIFRCSGNKTLRWWNDVPEGTVLYAAPVLLKQPERSRQHFGSLCNQFWNCSDFEKISTDEEPWLNWNGFGYTHQVTRALWKMYQAAPAQPVIPERPELRYGDNVLWFLNELAAFDASDINSDDFDVYGEGRSGMEGCATISITELAADAAKLLSAQPVSKPYKLKDAVADIRNSGVEIDADKIKSERDALNSPVIPDGWKLVPIEPTAAMFHAFNDCDYGRKSMRERYIQMIEAAPTQESE